MFISDGPVNYLGPSTVDQFKVGSMMNIVENSDESSKLTMQIAFHRISFNQVLKTFLPIFILSLLVHSTFLIDIELTGDRFTGAVTAQLVLTTWISVVNGLLPETSYVKLVDIWLVWHLVITFLVVIFHIFIGKWKKILMGSKNDDIRSYDEDNTIDVESTLVKINNTAIVSFTIMNSLFYAVYFSLSLN